ncbi:MAG: serpin family protein [Polyangiaceae bacterium]
MRLPTRSKHSPVALSLLLALAACGGSASSSASHAPTGTPSGERAISSASATSTQSASAKVGPVDSAPDPLDAIVAIPKSPATDDETRQFATGMNGFAVEFYKTVKKEPNFVYSPYSAATAFALVYGAAKGETASQMRKTLHITLPQDRYHAAVNGLAKALDKGAKASGYKLNVANALWGSKRMHFAPDFLTLTKETYQSPLTQVDFTNPASAVGTINGWASEHTAGKIPVILSDTDIDPQATTFVLTNAIYFKGDWQRQFTKTRTQKGDFFLGSATEKQQAWLMHDQTELRYAEDGLAQVVELPYKGESLSLVVVLPKKVDGLPAVEKALSPELLASWTSALATRDVILTLPRFKMEPPRMNLVPPLGELGMEAPFAVDADFEKMGKVDCDSDEICNVRLQKAVQKAMIEINEEGSEAAAVTAIVGGTTITSVRPEPPPPVVFKADHPFVFFLRDRASGAVLFMGRLSAPPTP